MPDYEEIIGEFYRAFRNRDGHAMGSFYSEEATFSDPVFLNLKGAEIRGMWQMLCERGTDLQVDYGDIVVQGDRGSAKWDATYTFKKTNRLIRNRVRASFEFYDGKIIRHIDRFSFYYWIVMAMGPSGVIAGVIPSVRNRIRSEARRSLKIYMTRKSVS